MAPGDQQPVFGNYQCIVSIDGIQAGNFYSATPPSATIDAPEFKVWDAKGAPQNGISGGRQPSWSPVELSRGADSDHTIWDWFQATLNEGADKNKKEVKLEFIAHDDSPLFTWTLSGAVPTSYSTSGANAQTQEILVNTIQIKYESAVLS